MRKTSLPTVGVLLLTSCLTATARAQSDSGALEFAVHITPTAAKAEPVRQFTFYILTKSYTEIVKELEAQDALPSRNEFIDGLKVSPELRAWLKDHDIMDLTTPDLDKILTAEDILHVPEFLLAYQRSNSGGVTRGIPKQKYSEADKTANPQKYEKQYQEYMTSLKKFLQAYPETVSGVELELEGVNPHRQWLAVQSDHRRRLLRTAPEVAQSKYLAAKADTDLDGRALVTGLPPGHYWISSLNLDADAGDMRLRWDVPATIQPGKTARMELTNLNASDVHDLNP